MGLFDSIKKIAGVASGFFSGGWGTAIGVGLDLFGLASQHSSNKAAAEAQKKELEALKKASAVQTKRNVNDLIEEKFRAIASVTALSAASGVNPSFGTPVTVSYTHLTLPTILLV